MRRRVLPLLSVVPALALATSLTGCGLTDSGPRLDEAAEIDGQTVPLSRIDDVLTDYCAWATRNPESQPAVPRAQLRGQLVLGWAQTVAVAALAEQYDVPVPSDEVDRSTVVSGWGEDGQIPEDEYDSFEWLSWLSQKIAPLVEVGARATLGSTGQLPADEAQAQSAGLSLVQQWIIEHHLEVNPVFGDLDTTTGLFSADTLSVPVSAEAGTPQIDDGDSSTPPAIDVAALPDSERCGAKPASDTTEPAAPGA